MISKVHWTVKQIMKLSDKNKPNEDEEKWALNRKVKKLKRSWSYLKESSQILEPSSKSRKILPKVKKNTRKFFFKKEEICKEEENKSTRYKEMAEKILKQKNCGEEVKTSKNAVYICNKYAMSSQRNAAIQ